MNKNNNLLFTLPIPFAISTPKSSILLALLLIFSITTNAQNGVDWLEGSWGVTFPIYGGPRLNTEINNNGYDYRAGAQEIVDNLPDAGHIITNLGNFAASHEFTLRMNDEIGDVGSLIHESCVPSLENEQVIFDVLQIFKNSGKKVILYVSISYFSRASDEAQAAWLAYYTSEYGGDQYAAYKDLIKGYISRLAPYADGYWLDTGVGIDNSGNMPDFIAMIKETDPGAIVSANRGKNYVRDLSGIKISVDTDGTNDDDEREYNVILHEPLNSYQDFTHGHVTPIGHGAPTNSWGYDEFTLPNMIAAPWIDYNGKQVLKHGWFPTRRRWHLPQEDLMFDLEQAYRFVKSVSDAGASITFATTTASASLGNAGHMMSDEMAILKEVNDRLEMNTPPDFIPYTRPDGAWLVGEQELPSQSINFPAIPTKEVGDADFSPGATASSGLSVSYTSSNPKVAVIENGKIKIIAPGTSIITASQIGVPTYRCAPWVTKILTVNGTSPPSEDNLALNGTATQSSNHPDGGGEASLAIDENTNGVWGQGSVTRTSNEKDPWWQVDLGSDYVIDTIKVFARTDNCCNTRLSNFDVIVIDSNGNTTYTKTYNTYPDPSTTVDVGGVTGQIIKIQQYHTGIVLNLAEVEVYGSEQSACTTFTKIEAEDYDTMSGVEIESSADSDGGQQIGYIQNGDWLRFNNIDVTCASTIDARVSSKNSGGDIEVRLDGVSGTLIATIPVATTGSWTTYDTVSSAINSVSGTHDIYLVFTGGNGYLLNLNWFEFNESSTITIPENQTVGPWDITELREVPNWETSTVDAEDGMTGILYESIDYLGNKVEVFAYYSAPSGTPPVGGWPAAIFAHGGGGTAFPQAVKYWNDKGYAAISMDLEGQYPNNENTPNPGPRRVGVWDDYKLPIEEQWYYHAVAQILKAHSLIASFPEVNANKIGLIGASWGGTLTSTVMGVDNRLAWAIPVYGAGFLSESDGHQGDALAAGDETEFVNANYDGSIYFDNVTFPTLWLNGLNDHHFSITCNQLSSEAVQGPTTLMYLDNFAHGHLTWRNRDEVYIFANQVVNGGVPLPEFEKPYMISNKAYATASSSVGLSSAELFYTTDGDEIDWNERNWSSIDANISGNTISANIPTDAHVIFFTATDSRDLMVTSEYLLISDTSSPPATGENLALNGTAEQSSTNYGAEASRAIDGNTNGTFNSGSVTHTNADQTPYWQVTLDSEYSIGDINIFGRTDDCCLERLSNFTVMVYDSNGERTFVKTFSEYPDPSITINAGGVNGNLIRIRSNLSQALSLAEVEVYRAVECTSFSVIQAEDFDTMSGVVVESSSDTGAGQQLGYIQNGDWSMFSNIDLSCATSIDARVSSIHSGGNIEVRLDGVSGTLITTIPITTTGSWTNYTTLSELINSEVSGTHDVYLVFTGGNGYLLNLNWIEFSDSQEKTNFDATNIFSAFPNPVTDILTINTNGSKAAKLDIINYAGQYVFSQHISEENLTVDLSNLSSGIYMVKITDEKQIQVKKIIKI
ncbi:carbohydrate-binding protein [Aquimarina pacifica]|uniref:carbohydrate-binding protein n=1 Tax=Aquimarina pacifica TaxID=1296415 RepID=UPI000471E8E9|nr:carbohydrate-binding protein [Aquimarina pacifica]